MTEHGKKRKRTDKDTVKPSKKAAIQVSKPADDIVISVVLNSDELSPVVGKNLLGHLSPTLSFSNYIIDNV
jgi:hypothetical protein